MRDGAHHVAHASLRAGEAASYRPCTEKVKQTGELNPVGVSEVEACPELVEGACPELVEGLRDRARRDARYCVRALLRRHALSL